MYDKPLVQELYQKSGILNPCFIDVITHMAGVAAVAGFLARKLILGGQTVNVELVETACMLHDIGKAFNPDLMGHVDAGIAFLSQERVNSNIINLVRVHQFWSNNTEPPQNWEETLVFFSDMVFGQQIMPFRERVNDVLNRYQSVLNPAKQSLLQESSKQAFQKIIKVLPEAKIILT